VQGIMGVKEVTVMDMDIDMDMRMEMVMVTVMERVSGLDPRLFRRRWAEVGRRYCGGKVMVGNRAEEEEEEGVKMGWSGVRAIRPWAVVPAATAALTL